MPNYQNGKIYAIRSHLSDKIYVGSTCNSLTKRFSQHKNSFSICKSRELIELGDAYIELIENYPCNDRNELNKREGHHIRNNNCVNKFISGLTRQESGKDAKYREKNREVINEKRRLYYAKYRM
jgi:hypothetical protein